MATVGYPLSSAVFCAIDGLFPRNEGQAGGRHCLYGIGLQQAPISHFPEMLASHEARRADGRRLAELNFRPFRWAGRFSQSDQSQIS